MATPKRNLVKLILAGCLAVLLRGESRADDGFASTYRDLFPAVESRVVKIYGAGGIRGLEAYQTGICISPDGHLLTVWSYVLDTDEVVAVFTDGRRAKAELVGADPITEVAVLKCDLEGEPADYFDLHQQPTLGYVGQPILALSNLFGIATGDEPVSVVHGVISSVAPLLARRGAFDIRYRGEVYVVDAAANNPGAAGGALVDSQGRLLGILGKEVRSQLTNTWLNFAIPVQAFSAITENIIAGSYEPPPLDELNKPRMPLRLEHLGIRLVPEIVARTPPFIDQILIESAAFHTGLQPDDLIIMVDGRPVHSAKDVRELMERYESDSSLSMTVLRKQRLIEVDLEPTDRPVEGTSVP